MGEAPIEGPDRDGSASPGRTLGRIGVRARITLIAVAVVGLVLAASGWALITVTRSRIESSIRDAAEARADGVVALIQAGALQHPLPPSDPELLTQVVDEAGRVVASDAVVVGLEQFVPGTVESGRRVVEQPSSLFERYEPDRFEDDGPYVLVMHGVDLPEGPGRVLVAASLEPASQALAAVRPLLGIGLPLLLLVVGATTWLLAGRALRPVERIRIEASRISAEDLERRLPLPGTGDEIHRLTLTLNEMLDRLEESALRQRRFVSDASHELRSPLAALRTIVDVAARDGDPALPPSLTDDLSNEIERMRGLVDDLLYLTRADESGPAARRDEVDLDRLMHDEATSLTRRTSLRVDGSGIEPVRLIGDPDGLRRLIRNLTDNAIRHAGSAVWLEIRRRDGAAAIVVSDDGPGIPDADRERVFERFVRLDESRSRRSGGTGLGLAVARAVARAHGGDLVVAASAHGGATLEARLPIA